MLWFAIVVQILLVCVMVWMFWPLMLSASVGVTCAALLWKALQRKLVDGSAGRMVARMSVMLLGWGVAVGVLLWIPTSAYDPTLLGMVGAATAGVLAFVGVWLLGQIFTSARQWLRKQSANDRLPAEGWWIAGGVGSIAAFFAVLLLSPNMAGWMAWREQLLGYPTVQLRIPLAAAQSPAQSLQQRKVLEEWIKPLMVQGNRSIDRYSRGKHGTNHYHAVVPSRYRWQGDVLEVVLGGHMRRDKMDMYVQRWQGQQQGQDHEKELMAMLGWWPMAQAECKQQLQSDSLHAVLGLTRAQLNTMRSCTQERMAVWAESAVLLAGKVGTIDMQVLPRFSPWRWGEAWKTVDLLEKAGKADAP